MTRYNFGEVYGLQIMEFLSYVSYIKYKRMKEEQQIREFKLKHHLK